jgi:hypothetical protein
MADDMSDPTFRGLSAPAHGEWDSIVESVLRGIAHALNNRAAALSAVMELARDPGDDPGVVTSILGSELERVSGLVGAVRSMSSSKGTADAFAPADAATEALAVLRLHADLRDRTLTIDALGAQPLRLPRWMFVRALVVLGASATRSVEVAKVVMTSEGDWLIVRVDAGTSLGVPTPYLRELAHAMEGQPLKPADGYGFRVPTLAAIRRREGRAD